MENGIDVERVAGGIDVLTLRGEHDLSTATDVNVDTVEGRVTLHGVVPTETEKARAEQISRSIDGVRAVQNLLQVVPESEKKLVDASDDKIEDGVKAALQSDKTLDDVKVASVDKGVVLLKGKTPDLGAKLKAIELTLATPGVKRVSAEIETAPEK